MSETLPRTNRAPTSSEMMTPGKQAPAVFPQRPNGSAASATRTSLLQWGGEASKKILFKGPKNPSSMYKQKREEAS